MRKLTEENEKTFGDNEIQISIPKKEKIKAVSKKAAPPEMSIDNVSSKIDVIFDKSVEEIIDKTKNQKTVEPKKDNTWIWALVALLVTVLIAYLINKKNEETN